MGVIDTLTNLRWSFSGGIDSTWATTDIVAFISAAPRAIEITEMYLGMVGDTPSANEHLGMSWYIMHDATPGDVTAPTDNSSVSVAGHTGGNAVVPAGNYGTAAVADINVSRYAIGHPVTDAASLEYRELFADTWNLQIPYKQVFLEKDRPQAVLGLNGGGNNTAMVWRLENAPSVDITVRGHVCFRYVEFTLD